MRKRYMIAGMAIAGTILVTALGAGAWLFMIHQVERPKYRVLISEKEIEIREYPKMVVAEVIRDGDRAVAVRAGFSPLASYIFAKKRPGEAIPMTAPVTQQRAGADEFASMEESVMGTVLESSWFVRFMMPSQFSVNALPQPGNDDVRLKAIPASRRAVIRFSGVADDNLLIEQEQKLLAWLKAHDLTPRAPATYAYYNHPLTPGPLRRNEVMFDLDVADAL